MDLRCVADNRYCCGAGSLSQRATYASAYKTVWQKAAYVSSVVLYRGMVVATWRYHRRARPPSASPTSRKGFYIAVVPYWELPNAVKREIERSAERVARYFGCELMCVEYDEPLYPGEALPADPSWLDDAAGAGRGAGAGAGGGAGAGVGTGATRASTASDVERDSRGFRVPLGVCKSSGVREPSQATVRQAKSKQKRPRKRQRTDTAGGQGAPRSLADTTSQTQTAREQRLRRRLEAREASAFSRNAKI